MQDLHSVEISGGRLRLHHHDLKCPRCDSLNTKFCYFNNYNLSQPRHFCKGCRRYWTKGGVLRNVPVGGGIRKAKRSVKLNSKTNVPSSDAVDAEHRSMNSENLSSNISCHTANMTSANNYANDEATADESRSSSTNSTAARLLNFNEPSIRFFNFYLSSSEVMTIDPLLMNQSQQQNPLQWTETDWMGEIDYTRLESRRSNGGVAGDGDWQRSANQGYWTQNHWNADDHVLGNFDGSVYGSRVSSRSGQNNGSVGNLV